jgi:glycosyltransferase involved in cell wall biosynthesis
MKIGVIGTRGFPEIQGGIETHCMELYSRIALMDGNRITVYRRTPYLNSGNRHSECENIRFVDIPVPKSKNFETIMHSFLATVHAIFQHYDIVHYHNTGPGFFIPLLKFTRAKIFFTYHNVSYTQKKWSHFAKSFLNSSEKISLTHSDFVIFISDIIRSEMLAKYNIKSHKVISNGVNLPIRSDNLDYIDSLGLEKKKYVISIGRFLEEKGFDYLIRAFRKTEVSCIKLVIAGDTDYPTEYSERLKSLAKDNGVILTGFIKGEKLNQIYSFAKLFIMSSFEEGMPITLLEAMSYDLDVLASDIPANLKIGLDKDDYFKVGDENDLKEKIMKKLSIRKEHNFRTFLVEHYNWDKIALETYNTYKNLIN